MRKMFDAHKKLLHAVSEIAINRDLYEKELCIFETGDIVCIGHNNQFSKTVKFFGSYFEKKLDELITDIDILQILNFSDDFIVRLKEIVKSEKFKFVRFHCGYNKKLRIPWKIDYYSDNHYYDNVKVEEWVDYIRKNYPSLYGKISHIFSKDTISLQDIVNTEEILEKDILLLWTKDDIEKGIKIVDGLEYKLQDELLNYKGNKLIKFIYKYDQYHCLVDVNFREYKNKDCRKWKNNKYERYSNDVYKKFKRLGGFLDEDDLKEYQVYNRKIKELVGHDSHIDSMIECVEKAELYGIDIDTKTYLETHKDEISDNKIKYENNMRLVCDMLQVVYPYFLKKIKSYVIFENICKTFHTQYRKDFFEILITKHLGSHQR